jgi:hypothetical protein
MFLPSQSAALDRFAVIDTLGLNLWVFLQMPGNLGPINADI